MKGRIFATAEREQKRLLVTSNVQTILVMSHLSLVWRFECRSLSCYFLVLPYVNLNIFFSFFHFAAMDFTAYFISSNNYFVRLKIEMEDCSSTRLESIDRKSSQCKYLWQNILLDMWHSLFSVILPQCSDMMLCDTVIVRILSVSWDVWDLNL